MRVYKILLIADLFVTLFSVQNTTSQHVTLIMRHTVLKFIKWRFLISLITFMYTECVK